MQCLREHRQFVVSWFPTFSLFQVQYQSEQGAGEVAPIEGGKSRRARGAFDPEDPTMLRPLRLCFGPTLRPEMEGGEESRVAGDGGVRHPEQGGAYRACLSRGGESISDYSYHQQMSPSFVKFSQQIDLLRQCHFFRLFICSL